MIWLNYEAKPSLALVVRAQVQLGHEIQGGSFPSFPSRSQVVLANEVTNQIRAARIGTALKSSSGKAKMRVYSLYPLPTMSPLLVFRE